MQIATIINTFIFTNILLQMDHDYSTVPDDIIEDRITKFKMWLQNIVPKHAKLELNQETRTLFSLTINSARKGMTCIFDITKELQLEEAKYMSRIVCHDCLQCIARDYIMDCISHDHTIIDTLDITHICKAFLHNYFKTIGH